MIFNNRLNRVFIISTITFIFFVALYTTPSSATLQSWDLVDTSRHMDYDGNSKYMSYVTSGASTWNAHIAGVIRPDSALHIQDVYCSDINKNNGHWGTTYPTGKIEFNKYYMDKSTATANDRKHTATHELGHGLKIDHNTSTPSTLMYDSHNTTYTLGTYEKSSYTAAYLTYPFVLTN